MWAAVQLAEEVGAGLGFSEILFGAVSAGVRDGDAPRRPVPTLGARDQPNLRQIQ